MRLFQAQIKCVFGDPEPLTTVDGVRVFHETREQAQAEIDEYVEDVRLAVQAGSMDPIDESELFIAEVLV